MEKPGRRNPTDITLTKWSRSLRNIRISSSGQDGGVSRNPSLPHAIKRRITTNLKSINNQKCQKIKLRGTPTTKELKKKSTRTTRPVRRQTAHPNSEKPWRGGLLGRGWLQAKLRLRVDCGLWRLPQWEKLPVSHESPLESALGMSRRAALFPPWPLPYRQLRSTTKTVALPRWIPKAIGNLPKWNGKCSPAL